MFCPFRSSSRWSWWPSWCPTSMSLLKTTESKILSCKDILTPTFLSYTSNLCPDKLWCTCFIWSFSSHVYLLFIQNLSKGAFIISPVCHNRYSEWSMGSVCDPTKSGTNMDSDCHQQVGDKTHRTRYQPGFVLQNGFGAFMLFAS